MFGKRFDVHSQEPTGARSAQCRHKDAAGSCGARNQPGRLIGELLAAAGRLLLTAVERYWPDVPADSPHARAMQEIVELFEAAGRGETTLQLRYDAQGRLVSIALPLPRLET